MKADRDLHSDICNLRWIARAATTLLLLVLAAPLRAAETPTATESPVQVRARVEPGSVTIGTPFRFIVEIEAPQEAELVIPLLGERFGDFSVTDFGEATPKVANGHIAATRWFTLVAYETGDKLLPPFPVKYRIPGEEMRDAESAEVLVIVDSLLAKDTKATDIRDIAPPEPVPVDWRPWLLLGGAVLALIGLAGGLFWILERRRAAAAAPPTPADEVALDALANLRARRLLESGRFEEYYVAISSIVRTYAEDRFGLRAPEMTTEEFLIAAQQDRRLTAEHRGMLGEFLTQSDLVKFARLQPAVEDGERAYDAARRFIQTSRLPGAEEAKRAAA